MGRIVNLPIFLWVSGFFAPPRRRPEAKVWPPPGSGEKIHMKDILLEKVKELVGGLLTEQAAELVEITYRRESGGMVLRLLVDKAGGITLDDCTYLNEKIGEILDSEDVMPEKYFSNTAGYASLRHSVALSEGVTLAPSAGVRLNRHSAFENEIAPEAGLSLLGDRWHLYANYARGFNYAGIYSVWFYNVAWNYQEEAYKDLEPERVHHFELGIKYNLPSNLNLDLSLFHDRGSNRIRMIPPPPPPPVFSNVDS